MVQVINSVPSFGAMLGRNLGSGISQGLSKGADLSMQMKAEKAQQEAKTQRLNSLLTPDQPKMSEPLEKLRGQPGQGEGKTTLAEQMRSNNPEDLADRWKSLSPQQRLGLANEFPQIVTMLQRESSEQNKLNTEEKKLSHKEKQFDFEKEKFSAGQSQKQREKLQAVAEGLPERRMSINSAKSAVQSDQMTPFGGDFWADVLNVPGLKTESGALLLTAAKNNLLAGLGSLPGGRPNQFIEKQLSDAFAKAGQTKEANMAQLLFAEAKLDMDENKVNIADQIQDEYEKEGKIAPESMDREIRKREKEFNENRMEQLSYQLQENREKTFKPDDLKALKPVPKGTPLTYEMRDILLDEVDGDPKKAEKLAKGLGYTIPDISFYYQEEM